MLPIFIFKKKPVSKLYMPTNFQSKICFLAKIAYV